MVIRTYQTLLPLNFPRIGKDATDDFEDVGHSDNAREMMDQYYVGEIDASTIPKKVAYTPPKQPHYNQDKTSEFIIKLLQFLVPLAILGLAVAIRFYTKQAWALDVTLETFKFVRLLVVDFYAVANDRFVQQCHFLVI